jgi:hypothetical protein
MYRKVNIRKTLKLIDNQPGPIGIGKQSISFLILVEVDVSKQDTVHYYNYIYIFHISFFLSSHRQYQRFSSLVSK